MAVRCTFSWSFSSIGTSLDPVLHGYRPSRNGRQESPKIQESDQFDVILLQTGHMIVDAALEPAHFVFDRTTYFIDLVTVNP